MLKGAISARLAHSASWAQAVRSTHWPRGSIRQYQAAGFGNGDEFHRRDQSALGMLPAHQGLCPDQANAVSALGLVIQETLSFAYCLTQIRFQRGPGDHRRVHLRFK